MVIAAVMLTRLFISARVISVATGAGQLQPAEPAPDAVRDTAPAIVSTAVQTDVRPLAIPPPKRVWVDLDSDQELIQRSIGILYIGQGDGSELCRRRSTCRSVIVRGNGSGGCVCCVCVQHTEAAEPDVDPVRLRLHGGVCAVVAQWSHIVCAVFAWC